MGTQLVWKVSVSVGEIALQGILLYLSSISDMKENSNSMPILFHFELHQCKLIALSMPYTWPFTDQTDIYVYLFANTLADIGLLLITGHEWMWSNA